MKKVVPLICSTCGVHFDRPSASCFHKTKTGKYYCSPDCQYKSMMTKVLVDCKQCGKKFFKAKCHIKKFPNNFCCHSCASRYNNKHKKWGCTRSKLEIFIEKQLTLLYPSLEIHYNRRDAINAELDIYIPSMKLAIELNGIFHYEPIFGEEKLKYTQNNDKRKFQACLEKNIEFCIIDTSKSSYLNEKKNLEFLLIITNIIDTKLKS